MTTYYVRKTGSDGAAGTSPSTAWATIGKALGASGIASGDTVYVGAGVYREILTVAMTSATVETKVIADLDGSQTGDAGLVRWTSYLTNDKTIPSASRCLSLSARDFLTFEGFHWVGGQNGIVDIPTGSTDLTFRRCTFIPWANGEQCVSIVVAAGVTANLTFDKCTFLAKPRNAVDGSIQISLNRHTSDYNCGISFTNCAFYGSGGTYTIRVVPTGSGTGFGGGMVVNACSSWWATNSFVTADGADLATSIPITVTNCLVWGGSSPVAATTLGQLTEDYNVLMFTGSRLNVTAGTHSISDGSYAPLFHTGHEVIAESGALRPFGMPMADSPFLGYGGTGQPSVDILGASRPSGGQSPLTAVGAYERSNTFVKETGTVRTGAYAISQVGPGYQDFDVAVDTVSTTVSAYVRWDATYAGTKPRMQVLNGTEAGVADDTATATGSSGAWEQIALSFTPTAQGVVTLRFVSSDTNGAGVMFVDDVTIT